MAATAAEAAEALDDDLAYDGDGEPILPHVIPKLPSLLGAAAAGRVNELRALLDAAADAEPAGGAAAAAADAPITPLLLAATYGHAAAAALLLERGADVLCVSAPGSWTALHAAAANGHVEVVAALLRAAAAAGKQQELLGARGGDYQRTALHLAVKRGEMTDERGRSLVVAALLEAGADADARDKCGLTPLHHAADRPAVAVAAELVQQLLRHGATAGARGCDGMAPLERFFLSLDGDEDASDLLPAVDALLAAGADAGAVCGIDLHGRDDEGDTLLHCAAACGWPPIVERLLQAGAGADARNALGATALHAAVGRFGTSARRLVVVQLLLDRGGADVNARDDDAATPLHRATRAGAHDVAQLLLQHGADAAARDAKGRTTLHKVAAARPSAPAPLVELLLQVGVDVNGRDSNGDTPLNFAVGAGGDAAVVQLLLQHGAKADARNEWGDTPLHCVAGAGRNAEVVKLLLQRGAEVDARDDRGDTPLGRVFKEWRKGPYSYSSRDRPAAGTFLPLVNALLAAGADARVVCSKAEHGDGDDGDTLLHRAATWGAPAVVERLLQAGADVNARNAVGRTPLEALAGVVLQGFPNDDKESNTVDENDLAALQLLVSAGADSSSLSAALRAAARDADAPRDDDDDSDDDDGYEEREARAKAARAYQLAVSLLQAGADPCCSSSGDVIDNSASTAIVDAAARGNAGLVERMLAAAVAAAADGKPPIISAAVLAEAVQCAANANTLLPLARLLAQQAPDDLLAALEATELPAPERLARDGAVAADGGGQADAPRARRAGAAAPGAAAAGAWRRGAGA